MDVTLINLEEPAETRTFPKGKFEVYEVGPATIGRATYEPGWRWSDHVGSQTGEKLCQVEHVGLVVSGRAAVAMEDGTERVMGPGDFFYVPPGHDSWVVGDEPYVSLHIMGSEEYAKDSERSADGFTIAVVSATALDVTALAELGAAFRGELVGPEHPDYRERRKIWNASIDRRPALIARCADAGDVAAAIQLAQRTGLQVAVRSGGHSFPGMSICDDGLVVDTSLMKGIEIADGEQTVKAGAGVLLGELDAATQRVGMAVPAGIVTHTGLAGLTLGGGIGWLQRKYGLTIDQLASVEIVTAGGERLRASEDENADLFWGVRGGGGNFGVVTEFEFRLNPLSPIVYAGAIAWAMEDSPEVLRFYRDWITDVPDELTTIIVHRRAPVSPFIPEELHGRHVLFVGCCWAGAVDDGEKVLAPLRAFKRPLLDLCLAKPFVEHQAMFDATFPHGRWYYFQSHDVDRLTDEVIDTVVEHCLRIESPHSGSPIFQLGGAIAAVPDEATAFSGRGAAHTININGVAETSADFERERDWVRGLWAALEPYKAGVYVNFMMDEGEERVRAAYGAEKFGRLQALKANYDPDNFFRLNQNIPPAAA